ncbi:MAG: PEP-CTERM sorting domain-containing protein [Phycisphaerales bacterium]
MRTRSIFAVAGLAVAASLANADVVATFTYDDLAGNFAGSGGNGVFTAVAVDTIALQSSGDASRLVPTEGDAVFEPGFVSGANPADFQISVTVAADSATHAFGAGTFIATDADGDTITGNIVGDWNLVGNFLAFSGNISNVLLNDNGASDNAFNGTDASSTDWSMALPGGPVFEGAIVNLVFGANDFFATAFESRATGVTAQIVPAPGVLALVGLGGLAAGRRRR